MAKFSVDFSDVQSFDPIPEGNYRVRVEEVEAKDNKAGDAKYLNWTLEIIEEGEYQGRKLWLMTSLKPNALWKLKEVFDGLGIEGELQELEWDDETGFVISPELVDLVADAVVTQEVYQGKVKNRVDELIASGGGSDSAPAAKEEGGKKKRKLK